MCVAILPHVVANLNLLLGPKLDYKSILMMGLSGPSARLSEWLQSVDGWNESQMRKSTRALTYYIVVAQKEFQIHQGSLSASRISAYLQLHVWPFDYFDNYRTATEPGQLSVACMRQIKSSLTVEKSDIVLVICSATSRICFTPIRRAWNEEGQCLTSITTKA